MKIFCFGDSITRGENDHLHGGWADRLKRLCIARFMKNGGEEVCVFNLGIGGENTNGLKARFQAELDARRGPEEPFVVLLGYGANDAARRGGTPHVAMKNYIANLRACVDEARRRGGDARLLTITPVARAADGKTNAGGNLRSNAFVREYNNALRALAAKHDVGLLDVHAAFVKAGPETLFVPDGIHPNALGHELIYNLASASLGVHE